MKKEIQISRKVSVSQRGGAGCLQATGARSKPVGRAASNLYWLTGARLSPGLANYTNERLPRTLHERLQVPAMLSPTVSYSRFQ